MSKENMVNLKSKESTYLRRMGLGEHELREGHNVAPIIAKIASVAAKAEKAIAAASKTKAGQAVRKAAASSGGGGASGSGAKEAGQELAAVQASTRPGTTKEAVKKPDIKDFI